jgi:hypothetical protein
VHQGREADAERSSDAADGLDEQRRRCVSRRAMQHTSVLRSSVDFLIMSESIVRAIIVSDLTGC